MEPAAWDRLCALYAPVVYGWCRRAGLQESDAADANQEVFRAVLQHLDQFQGGRQGGSFRGWLWSITANQVRLHFRRARRQAQAPGGDGQHMLAQLPDAGLPADEPDADLSRRRILQRALDLVRGDFSASTWAVFERTTLQNDSYQQVAADLGMSENAVRQARFRVLCRLRQELEDLL
jgi:RNA polymerase sigma-70 factor (ECF subfamily)